MASKITIFEKQLKMYIEELSDFFEFSQIQFNYERKYYFSDDTDIETLEQQFLKQLGTFNNDMNSRFNGIKNLSYTLQCFGNP